MPIPKLIAFVLFGIAVLQVAVLLQHGELQSPRDFPVPIIIGILLGVALGVSHHVIVSEARRAQHDLLEKEELIRALAKSEERLSLATSRSHVWDWDVEKDELYLSPGLPKSLGYTPEEMTAAMQGTTVNLMHTDDIKGYREKLNAHFKDQTSAFSNEHRFRTKSGEYKWFLAFGYSERDEHGKVVRFAGTTTDVSDRVTLETHLRQSQKMEAIGKLTGGIAHDFNNLLAVTLGNLELLEDENDQEMRKELINAAKAATIRGADLTKNMLSFARKASLSPVPLELNKVVADAKNWMARTLPESIVVETSLLAGLWSIEADRSSLESALLNLILNARDAMAGQGELTIETANVRIDDAYIASRQEELAPGRYVMLAISDTGVGIASSDQENIFEPFFTTKPPGVGSGLGLSMIVGFMQQSGGTVQVYSEVGTGTTFKLYFSAVNVPSSQLTRQTPQTAGPLASGERVLVAEDELAVREMLVRTLEKAGYEVTAAVSGDNAYTIFEADPTFDMLLTDIVMPGTLQGTDLAKELRKIRSDLPVVFLSGYANEATVHGNGLRPEDIRLMKPIQRSDLIAAVAKALETLTVQAGSK